MSNQEMLPFDYLDSALDEARRSVEVKDSELPSETRDTIRDVERWVRVAFASAGSLLRRDGVAKLRVFTQEVALEQIPQTVIAELTKHPYTKPFQLEYTKYLWGSLRGKNDALSANDQEYPIVRWRSKVSQKAGTTGPDPEVTFAETITPRLGAGIALQLRRLEVWGPKPDEEERKPPALQGPS